jgi:hypothetical protein
MSFPAVAHKRNASDKCALFVEKWVGSDHSSVLSWDASCSKCLEQGRLAQQQLQDFTVGFETHM